ncbi:ankyrin unc44 [Colletotrichum karsti]|uniref:Ankyrin unc44 n=1 Tax=Colletotrichum karsti TaxID=1095194 RepID=A0A9P6LFP9_9PEZI|nr:ankyrin unc44 [Colletotrichum karsti]KAF9871396.1 ankyrin unc44 [Colletotrichum karsti]
MEIGRYVDFEGTHYPLGALARVNRQLHEIFRGELYRAAVRDEMSDITFDAAADGNLDTLKVAAEFGADFDTIYDAETTQEISDVWYDSEALNRLAGYDSDDSDDDNDIGPPKWAAFATPLCMAAFNGHYDVVKWLLARGVNINTPGRFVCDCTSVEFDMAGNQENAEHPLCIYPAWTPLHFANCGGQTSVARLLLSAGADENLVRTTDSPDYPAVILSKFDGDTLTGAVGIAMNDPHGEIAADVNHLPVRLIHDAAASGDESLVKELVTNRGQDVDTPDGSGATPLYYAIMSAEHATVKQLLSLGADPTRPLSGRGTPPFTISAALLGEDTVVNVPAEAYFNALDYAVNNDFISNNIKDKIAVNFDAGEEDEDEEHEEHEEHGEHQCCPCHHEHHDDDDDDDDSDSSDDDDDRDDDDGDRHDDDDEEENYPCAKVILDHGGASWVDTDPFAATEGIAYPHSSLKLLQYWTSTYVDKDDKENMGMNVCRLLPSFVRSTAEHAGPKRRDLTESEMQISFLLALINPHFSAKDMDRFLISTCSIFSLYLPVDETEFPRFLRTFGRRDLRLDDKEIRELTSLSKQPRFHNFALCFLMWFAPLWPHTEELLNKVNWLLQQNGGMPVSVTRLNLVDATPLHTYLRRVEATYHNEHQNRLLPQYFIRTMQVAERTGPNGPKDMEHICHIVNALGRNGGWLPLKNGKGKDIPKVVELFADLPHLVKHGLGKRTKQSMPRGLISKLPGL